MSCHKVSDAIFAVKEKLTDQEYKEIMESLSKLNETTKLYKLNFFLPTVTEELTIVHKHLIRIFQIDDEDAKKIQKDIEKSGFSVMDSDEIDEEWTLDVPYIRVNEEEYDDPSILINKIVIENIIITKIVSLSPQMTRDIPEETPSS